VPKSSMARRTPRSPSRLRTSVLAGHIFHKDALGDLEKELPGSRFASRKAVSMMSKQPRIANLAARNVDLHVERRWPACRGGTCGREYLGSERQDQPVVLGYRTKTVGGISPISGRSTGARASAPTTR